MKRIFDFILALIGLIIISPAFLVIAIVNKISAKEVFFIQDRIGAGFKPFRMYKFATMVKNAHIVGGTVTYNGDPRVTRLGAILRNTKLNELPQLINVLKGDMSFVGPRPLPLKEIAIYDDSIARRIYSIRPGVTGLGSLYFFNEEKLLSNDKHTAENFFKNTIVPQKADLELWYVDNRTFLFDLKVIIATLSLVFIPGHFVLSYISKKLIGSNIGKRVDEIMDIQQNARSNGR
jgi:lipopolysaccharide/colanic/teichoic acid biosynthesis glycosyltransferase